MPIKLLLGARQPREVLRKDHNGAPPPPAKADVDGTWLLRLYLPAPLFEALEKEKLVQA
jgi:hypothetical protein